MIQDLIKQFEGYDDIVRERETARKYSQPYTADKDEAEKYINRLHPARIRMKVLDVIEETADAKTLRLAAVDGYLPPFLAGQYVAVLLEVDGIRTSRPYSISSAPNQRGHYDLTVRRVEGGLVSNYLLDRVQPGDALETSGPAGHFHFNPLIHDRELVCIAGGSGITPFMSMIREIADCGLDRTVHLLYGVRRLEEAIFHDVLTMISSRNDWLRYHPVVELPPPAGNFLSGYISAETIQAAVGGVEGKTFFLCGPQAMYDFCLPQLETLGAPKRKTRREVYGPPAEVTVDPGWPADLEAGRRVTIRTSDGRSLTAPVERPLLSSLEENGLVLPSICRSGECGMCRVRVLSGRVFQPAGALVRKSDRWFGYVHACASYPLEDLEIVL